MCALFINTLLVNILMDDFYFLWGDIRIKKELFTEPHPFPLSFSYLLIKAIRQDEKLIKMKTGGKMLKHSSENKVTDFIF